mgnify:FL=1
MAERWVSGKGYVPVPNDVEKFLAAVMRQCHKYGLALTFNLDTNALVVSQISEDNLCWLTDAEVDPKVACGLIRD